MPACSRRRWFAVLVVPSPEGRDDLYAAGLVSESLAEVGNTPVLEGAACTPAAADCALHIVGAIGLCIVGGQVSLGVACGLALAWIVSACTCISMSGLVAYMYAHARYQADLAGWGLAYNTGFPVGPPPREPDFTDYLDDDGWCWVSRSGPSPDAECYYLPSSGVHVCYPLERT